MFSEEILDLINKFGNSAFSKIVFGGYATSYKTMKQRLYYGNNWETKENFKYKKIFNQKELEKKEKQKFYNLLSYLRKKGFIEKKKIKGNKVLWRLTQNGLNWLKKKKMGNKIPILSFKPFEKIKKDHLKIIIFDIPENDKWKRNWLRQSLKNLEFKMLQKSVWIGKSKLPEEFIFKLRDFKILSYIHIFKVKEKGTIDFIGN